MQPKRINQRARALTIYFATTREKKEFVDQAKSFGLTASTLGALMLYKAMEDGFYPKLRAALASDPPSTIARTVVTSERPRPRPAAKKKSS
jgi:hypothetical protein